MVASEAVQVAKAYILQLYEDEDIGDVGLEELEFSDEASGIWHVTIGFRRRWQKDSPGVLFSPGSERTYKTVRIHDDGTVISMKHRDVSVPT